MKKLTIEDFIQGVSVINNGRITNIAPMGFSGDTLVLDGLQRNAEGHRESLVSLRKYCNQAELLITDKEGRFLTYQKYGLMLGIDYIAHKFYEVWSELSGFIESDMNKEIETVFSSDAKRTVGFKILELAHSAIEATELLSEAAADIDLGREG